jgi:hypothetical protein
MVHQGISPDQKEQVLYLLFEEGWEIECIAAALGVSSTLEKYRVVGGK